MINSLVKIIIITFFFQSHLYAKQPSSCNDGELILRPANSPLPNRIMPPVNGRISISSSDFDYKWSFNQWGNTGKCGHPFTHCAYSNGLGKKSYGGANDTYAYDINIKGNGDFGQPVFAVADGIVVKFLGAYKVKGSKYYENKTSNTAIKSYGAILLEHSSGNGKWYSIYMHMNPVNNNFGDTVKKNDIVGYVSDKGVSGVHHLHFAIYIPQNINLPTGKNKISGKDIYEDIPVLQSVNLTSYVESSCLPFSDKYSGDNGFSDDDYYAFFNKIGDIKIPFSKNQSITIPVKYTGNLDVYIGISRSIPLNYADINKAEYSSQTYWVSSNKNVVKVDGSGNITALSSGIADITVYFNGSKSSIRITVTN